MRDFRKLLVWEKAHHLALNIYSITKDFPTDEKFGLTSQIRRASLSIPTNIAEGAGHDSNKEFARYLRIASASTSEVEYLLEFSKDLKLINIEIYQKLNLNLIEVKKMLYSLVRKNT